MTRRAYFFAPLLIGLFGLAGFLSLTIDKNLNGAASGLSLEDALNRMLGSAKEVIGDKLFLKADEYFHGGSELKYEHHGGDLEKEGYLAAHETQKGSQDWIAAVNDQIRGHEHYHLTKEQQKEMLPFFSLATKLDPQNVEAILTTAYWLDQHFDRTDAAIEILSQGLKDNPGAWEIAADLAGIYFKRKQNYSLSESYYREAIRLSSGVVETKKHKLVDCYYYLGESCLRQGKKQEALLAYENALKIFTEENAPAFRKAITDKIGQLAG